MSTVENNDLDLDLTEIPEHDVSIAASKLRCVPPEYLYLWRQPPPSPWHTGRVQNVFPHQTIKTLCNSAPSIVCLHHRGQGRCVRGDAWWSKRIIQIARAMVCGCDPLTCGDCHTGGRVPKQCEWCQHVTGWEREHGDWFVDTAKRLLAGGALGMVAPVDDPLED